MNHGSSGGSRKDVPGLRGVRGFPRGLLGKIGGAARQRYVKLEEKRRRWRRCSARTPATILFRKQQRRPERLTWLYSHHDAQRNIVTPRRPTRRLQKKIAATNASSPTAPTRRARLAGATSGLLKSASPTSAPRDLPRRDRRHITRIETRSTLPSKASLRGRHNAISRMWNDLAAAEKFGESSRRMVRLDRRSVMEPAVKNRSDEPRSGGSENSRAHRWADFGLRFQRTKPKLRPQWQKKRRSLVNPAAICNRTPHPLRDSPLVRRGEKATSG